MNTHFQNRLQEVSKYYHDDDQSLAFRRLMDCALETQNLDVFRATLTYCEWLEQKEQSAADKQQKAFELLSIIEKAGVQQSGEAYKILEASAIRKDYAKGNFRLSPLDISLNTGEIIGLVGENGNGKTTLLRLLAAELKPDSGTINYAFHQSPNNYYDLRTRLIYIEQRIEKWYGGLMDNLQFTLANYGIKGEANILWAEMMVARLGLRPFREMSWSRISSGYKTRFELARTLLRRPQILLLDEPLANLDIMAQQTILQDLKFMSASLSAPFGMVLSSQHIYEVEKVSDKIIFLRNGVPQYQSSKVETAIAEQQETSVLIYELETSATRDQLQEVLHTAMLDKLQFNGGVYTLYFKPGASSEQILEALAHHKIAVQYLRNITHSSRRFFNN